ncbi:MAG: hypothetical protein LBL98_02070 [Ruminococcus sp.]|jgi:uncharacterized Zn finger protein|nr:hypothetical protein [Ruminococcus sp.]
MELFMEEKDYIGVTEDFLEEVVGGADANSRILYRCSNCGYEHIFENTVDFLKNRQGHSMSHCAGCGEMGYVRLDTLED